LAGIVSYGIYLPGRILTSREIAELSGIPQDIVERKQGILAKRVSDEGEMPTEMAVKAARKALEEARRAAGIRPDDIGAVLYVGSEFKDYGVWMAATKIQHDLGLRNAFAFDVASMCVGMVVGLALAKRMGDLAENILVTAASKESYLVNYRNPATSWLNDFADGASAVVISHGYSRNRILESAFISDGRFHGAVVVKSLGAVVFREPELLGSRPYFESIMEKEELKAFLEPTSRRNFVRVIREALDRSGLTVKDVDLLVLNHMKGSFHMRILDDLGIPPERAPYLEEYGHTQSSDMIIGLDIGIKKGLVKEGSIVVFASGGTGFLWGATVVRWG